MAIFHDINVRVHNIPIVFQQLAWIVKIMALKISCTNLFGYEFTKLSCE